MNASRPTGRAKLAFLLCLALVAALRWAAGTPTPPVDQVQSQFGWADEQSCRQCHQAIVDAYDQTGHRHTLTRGDAPASTQKLTQLSLRDEPANGSIRVLLDGDYPIASFETDQTPRRVELDWCFGSGLHARTWVASLPGGWGESDMLEFRWSWYSMIDGFAVTPGQDETPEPGYFSGLGTLKDSSRAVRCFACHASYIPVQQGRIDFHGLVAGVHCQRCHGPQQRHVHTGGAAPADRFWSDATPLESINRCGECHRRADETPADQIRPDNEALARFQPVGLAQSPCFQKSNSMTCMTCHDPHRSLQSQDSRGVWQCLQCHDPNQRPDAALCSASRRDDCLACHMPKVKQQAPLEFTDHWIRVRERDAER